jgi:dihydroorotate dehydrogenase (NAD+) catalytic subunit
MLNSIGLENVGVEAFLRDKLPFLRDLGISVWVNFFGTDFATYIECARGLGAGQGIDALEMNISCPNIKHGGIEFGTVPEVAHRLTRACVEVTDIPIVVKLTPNVADIVAMADAVKQAGAMGVSLINTITGMAIDVRTRGRRSPPPTAACRAPRSSRSRCAWSTRSHTALPDLPICGMGGILGGEDALEFLMAGARCVQVGTANFAEPGAGLRVTGELQTLMAELGLRVASPTPSPPCDPGRPRRPTQAPSPGAAST